MNVLGQQEFVIHRIRIEHLNTPQDAVIFTFSHETLHFYLETKMATVVIQFPGCRAPKEPELGSEGRRETNKQRQLAVPKGADGGTNTFLIVFTDGPLRTQTLTI